MTEPRILLEEPSREEWLAARRRGIGGSEVAALIGAHPYLTPMKLWLQKTGRIEADEETPRMRLGKAAEPMLLAEYEREVNVRCRLNTQLYVHASSPIILGTPDAFRVEPDDEGVELKWHGAHARRDFGEAGTDEVPDHHFCQATYYAGLTGRPRWHFGVLFGNEGITPFTIRFDADLFGVLVEAANRFWRDHVEKDVPPEIDGSPETRAYAEKRFPRDREPLRPASPAEEGWLRELLDVREALRAMSAREDELGTFLRVALGDAAGLEVAGLGRVTWKATKDVSRVDWKAVFSDLLPKLPPDLMAAAEAIVADRTTVSAGSRRFLPTDLRKKEN